jgi:capsular polysaccharide biosynthesis protein
VWICDRLSHNYYHWICDALPRLEAYLLRHETARLMLPRRVHDQPFVRDCLAVYHNVEAVEPPPKGQAGRMERVWLIGVPAPEARQHPLLMASLRTRLTASLGGGIAPSGKRLHVSRAGARFRRLANEAALAPVFARHGYETVHLERMPFGEQVRLLAGATHVCGVHGAGLTNMLFMLAGGWVTELRRPHGSPLCFQALSGVCGHQYQHLACESDNADAHHHTGDLVADPDALDAALEAAG